jgi:hypothetical protein
MIPRIESGIPIPKRNTNEVIYPFDRMAVGDSFEVMGNKNKRVSLLTAANNWARKHSPDAKFSTRLMGRYVRIWRIE